MSELLYVATDANGVEHAVDGEIEWQVAGIPDAVTSRAGEPLMLRNANALLDVIDERIFVAEPDGDVLIGPDGTAQVTAARLVRQTDWDAATATQFALSCAAHIVEQNAALALPDGTSLREVIEDAQNVLANSNAEAEQRFGYLARLGAFRRLRRERAEVTLVGEQQMADALSKDVEALESPTYATTVAVVDALLAAIESARHQLLPRYLASSSDDRASRETYSDLDGKDDLSVPRIHETPFGSFMVGGGPYLSAFEPPWTSARDAARHTRNAARDQGGKPSEDAELAWQARALEAILTR